jgi:hypothetical protein
MKTLAGLSAALMLSGCAAHHVPPPTVSADWSTVRALAPGTELAVYVGDQEVRFGRLTDVSAEELMIARPQSVDVLPRKRIDRIAIRISTGLSRRGPMIKSAVIAAIICTGIAWLAQAWAENPPQNQFKWKFVVAGTAAGAAVGSVRAPAETFRERLVYMRP